MDGCWHLVLSIGREVQCLMPVGWPAMAWKVTINQSVGWPTATPVLCLGYRGLEGTQL